MIGGKEEKMSDFELSYTSSEINEAIGKSVNLEQTIGENEDKIMSQKATTEAMNKISESSLSFIHGTENDFNNYTEVGFYSLINPLYNVPDTSWAGNYSYSLIVNKGKLLNGTYDLDQLAISENGDFYIRHKLRSYSTWKSWIRISNSSIKPLEVLYGGTGANNSKTARTNLDVYSKEEVDELISNIVQNQESIENV